MDERLSYRKEERMRPPNHRIRRFRMELRFLLELHNWLIMRMNIPSFLNKNATRIEMERKAAFRPTCLKLSYKVLDLWLPHDYLYASIAFQNRDTIWAKNETGVPGNGSFGERMKQTLTEMPEMPEHAQIAFRRHSIPIHTSTNYYHFPSVEHFLIPLQWNWFRKSCTRIWSTSRSSRCWTHLYQLIEICARCSGPGGYGQATRRQQGYAIDIS